MKEVIKESQPHRIPLAAYLGVFGGAALGLYAYSKYRSATRKDHQDLVHSHEEQEVDTSSEDSFPASDPPAWSSGHHTTWEE